MQFKGRLRKVLPCCTTITTIGLSAHATVAEPITTKTGCDGESANQLMQSLPASPIPDGTLRMQTSHE